MLIDPESFDMNLTLLQDYTRFIFQDELYSDTLEEQYAAWWKARLPEDKAKAEEFRLRILSYVRDLEAEVLLLRPKAKAHDDMTADVEAGIEAQFKNEGALR